VFQACLLWRLCVSNVFMTCLYLFVFLICLCLDIFITCFFPRCLWHFGLNSIRHKCFWNVFNVLFLHVFLHVLGYVLWYVSYKSSSLSSKSSTASLRYGQRCLCKMLTTVSCQRLGRCYVVSVSSVSCNLVYLLSPLHPHPIGPEASVSNKMYVWFSYFKIIIIQITVL